MRRYQVAGPQVTWEEFDDEYVVLDLESGRYFSLAGGAALIWQGLLAGHRPSALAISLLDGSPALAAFNECVSALITSGLVVASTLPPTQDAAPSAGIEAAGTDYRFEAFDDLAALLVADPIHDVEAEAGWPHRPA